MGNKIILDWNEYLEAARKVVSEGCVLLKNENGALPLKQDSNVAVFGRIQTNYYKSGTGSGGMVNVSKVTGIVDGLKESGMVTVNQKLYDTYVAWEEENPFEEGVGWGNEPWSQVEMPLTDELVKEAAGQSDAAIVIIGRTAGEDKDSSNTPGAFTLTELELDMMKKVRAQFDRMIVLLNVGNVIDMSFMDSISPDAVMYVWQGGMTGGSGTADVLVGKVSPSGKLTDTIAYEISDYPSDKNFGDDDKNIYEEDIYVGYRYFETFAKDRVRYPFGFGLSYTAFETEVADMTVDKEKQQVQVTAKVTNTGAVSGKEVVQIYAKAPQGALGKADRVLIGFAKTKELAPRESQELVITASFLDMASYDDSGVTGYKSAFVLEQGNYEIYAGSDVRAAKKAGAFDIDETLVLEQLSEALAPVEAFNRMKPEADGAGFKVSMEAVPMATIDMEERRKAEIPAEIPQTGDKGIKLVDVLDGKQTMEAFVAQLSDEELASLVRGEGMGSSRVTPGTASAFGGVSDLLTDKGIPAVCCDDGPSGMRLDSGMKAFSLPNGTMIACTFNMDIVTSLYALTGIEMVANKVECLLGPGMNIHRHPLNGRNFEYFSEDPFMTGKMACAMLDGLHSAGVTGTVKHFCGNNQEKRRHYVDSVISERALREIYLKGFEMAVKDSKAYTVMTTYGSVNGLWTAGIYDLTTTILRKQWGFEGVVMTDWWAQISERGVEPSKSNFAAMVRAQNDLYMCCADGSKNTSDENTMDALSDGRLARAELQRTAINVCNVAMRSQAMSRLVGRAPEVEIINRPVDPSDIDLSDLEYTKLGDNYTVSLLEPASKQDTNYILAFEVAEVGCYKVTLTGSSTLSELAQLPVTLFFNGFPLMSFTFNGSDGKDVSFEKDMWFHSRFGVIRLYVAKNGLDLKSISFEKQDHEFVREVEKKEE